MYVLSIIVYVHNIHIWLLCSLIFTNKQRTLLKCVSIQGFIFSEGFCIVFSVVIHAHFSYLLSQLLSPNYPCRFLLIFSVQHQSALSFILNIAIFYLRHLHCCHSHCQTMRQKASILNKFLFYFLIKLANLFLLKIISIRQ